MCLIGWGLMVGIFWLMYTLRFLVYFIFQKPLDPDRIKEIIEKIQNDPA